MHSVQRTCAVWFVPVEVQKLGGVMCYCMDGLKMSFLCNAIVLSSISICAFSCVVQALFGYINKESLSHVPLC